jgi:hypothetical protein
MKLFAYAFLITLNLCLLGLVNLPDSVMREPEGDWCRAAEVRKAGWESRLKHPARVISESYSNVSGGESYHPSQQGVK